tara:strand:- start:1654 stop:1827 length:174 start_codon:yes stop_codon:yes gene_type:complete
MNISQEQVEQITSQQLMKLPINQEESIYDEEGIMQLADNDEITPAESGFMMGYLEAY